jgi:hypothetical protein
MMVASEFCMVEINKEETISVKTIVENKKEFLGIINFLLCDSLTFLW